VHPHQHLEPTNIAPLEALYRTALLYASPFLVAVASGPSTTYIL
jgi:hypothetical protein